MKVRFINPDFSPCTFRKDPFFDGNMDFYEYIQKNNNHSFSNWWNLCIYEDNKKEFTYIYNIVSDYFSYHYHTEGESRFFQSLYYNEEEKEKLINEFHSSHPEYNIKLINKLKNFLKEIDFKLDKQNFIASFNEKYLFKMKNNDV